MEKSPKGIILQMRHSYNMSKKDFIFIIYAFRIMVSTNVWAPCRVYSMHRPLWKAETRQSHGLLTIIITHIFPWGAQTFNPHRIQ